MVSLWPNWVDLLVVILVLRTFYVGFDRGVVTEVIALTGAIGTTVLTLNYAKAFREWDRLMFWSDSTLKTWVLFWTLFVLIGLAARIIVKRLSEVLKWERAHWMTQTLGGILAAARALWWSAFILVVLTSSGISALEQSVAEHSQIGSRWLGRSRDALLQVANRFPGSQQRGEPLIPPIMSGGQLPKE